MSFLSNLRNRPYLSRILTLTSGSAAAQATTIAAMPLLTRLYSPEEFGAFAFFLSLVSVIALVSSLSYQQAVMLPRLRSEALALLGLSTVLVLGFTAVAAVVVGVLAEPIRTHWPLLTGYLVLIPVGILLLGMNEAVRSAGIREQLFTPVARSRVVGTVVIVGTQLLGRAAFGIDSLGIGRFGGEAVILLLMGISLVRSGIWQERRGAFASMWGLAKRYAEFPKYRAPSVLANAVSQNLPVLLFASLFSAEIAGFYALAIRALKAPVDLVGGATRDVYYQQAARLYADGESFRGLYVTTTMGLVKLVVLPALVLSVFGGVVFATVFGEEWRTAGVMVQFLVVWIAIGFVNPPSVISFNILGLQKVQLGFEMVSLVVRCGSLLVGRYLFDSYLVATLLFTITGAVLNASIIWYIRRRVDRLHRERSGTRGGESR